MTDKAEARAIARFIIDWEYDRGSPVLVRIYTSDGPFVDYASHAAALAAKDAELAAVKAELYQSRNFWSDEFSAKNAQLAEAIKALDEAAAALRSRLTIEEQNWPTKKPYEHPLSALDRAEAYLARRSLKAQEPAQ